MGKDHYTNYPRTILWLIRGGETIIGGDEPDAQPVFSAVAAPFYISKHPITNLQYEAFDPDFERAPHGAGDRDPATRVSWDDACAYCHWYAHIAKKPFRLPTELEWEHACRAGERGRYFGHDDPAEAEDTIWHAGNSGGVLRNLEEKKTNSVGLYGMLGGVWEWTASPFRPYPITGAETADEGEAMVRRGGSYLLPIKEISCSRRHPAAPDTRAEDTGFRIARDFR